LVGRTKRASGGFGRCFSQSAKGDADKNFSLEDFRDSFLTVYQEKYPERSKRNYVAMINEIILMGKP
jgi:hypothetical protein